MNKVSLLLVGRFDKFSGVGWHGWSILESLAPTGRYEISILLTNSGNADREKLNSIFGVKIVEGAQSEGPLYDYSIFCDVLVNYPGDESWRLAQRARINCAYVVFDSTRIPDVWVKVINESIDLVLTPSEFVKKTCRDSRVNKPVVSVPLLVREKFRNNQSRIIERSSEGQYTFCFIGSLEDRKNVELLIKAFKKAFVGQIAVKLMVHLTYAHTSNAELKMFVGGYADEQIKIDAGVLTEIEYSTLGDNVDCFVSMSKGEGYSLIPREFLLSGIPVLLSHSAAHRELAELDGVYYVPSPVASPGYYPQIDGKHHGVQYSPHLQDVIYALQEMVRGNVRAIPNQKPIVGWSKSAIAAQLGALLQPTSVTLGPSFYASESDLVVNDSDMLDKYRAILGERIVVDRPRQRQKHVVVANDGGFFSIFNRFVSILYWETSLDPDAVVVPDWRVVSMIRHLGRSKFTSFCYGKESDGNIYLKLFKPIQISAVSETKYNDDIWLDNNSIFRLDYNEKYEPNLTYIHAYKLYTSSEFPQWRRNYNQVVKRHIALSDSLEAKVSHFVDTFFKDKYIIAAHVRHPSHSMEQPGGRLPTVDLFREYIDREIARAEATQTLPVRVFIATDQDSVVAYFRDVYRERFISVDATRTTLAQEAVYNSLDARDKLLEGFQIQHLMAADKDKNSVQMAEEVIVDAWLLARSNVFIHITSNVATAVAFLNPETQMIYCE